MSLSEERETVGIDPTTESLRLALSMAQTSREEWAAERVIRSAALFDAYLSGLISFSIHDCDSLDNGFHNLLLARIKKLGTRTTAGVRVDVDTETVPGFLSHSNSPGNGPDQVLSGHSAHSSSPSSDESHPTDSSSDGRDKSVSDAETDFPQFLGEMSGGQLCAIEHGFIPGFVKKLISQLATEEIKRRRAS